MPKLTTQKYGPGKIDWLGSSHAIDNARTLTIDAAKFKAKATDGVIPSGTPVALSDTSHKLEPYNHDGSGGLQKLVGFILWDQPQDKGDIAVAVLDQGRVYTDQLPGQPFTQPDPANDLTRVVYAKKENA